MYLIREPLNVSAFASLKFWWCLFSLKTTNKTSHRNDNGITNQFFDPIVISPIDGWSTYCCCCCCINTDTYPGTERHTNWRTESYVIIIFLGFFLLVNGIFQIQMIFYLWKQPVETSVCQDWIAISLTGNKIQIKRWLMSLVHSIHSVAYQSIVCLIHLNWFGFL